MSSSSSEQQSFQGRYQSLLGELRENPRQRQVLESRRHCIAIAGPGSGKTKTITGKVAQLLFEEVQAPHGVACITYSNECKNEIAQRLEPLGIEPSRRFFLGTTHAFCLRHVVRPFGHLAGQALPDVVAPDDDKKRLQYQALRDMRLSTSRDGLKDFDRARRDQLYRGESYAKTALGKAVLQYEKALADSGFTDFEEMVRVAVTLVHEFPWVRRVLAAKFPVIVVDEYQDLGYGLHKLVTTLQQAGIRLIAVGDPDQSIYDFNGAHPLLLQQLFDEHKASGEAVRLAKNYRCGQAIIDTSLMAMATPHEVEAHNTHEGRVEAYVVEGELRAQAAYAVDVLMPRLEAMGIPRGEIGFLYHDKHGCRAVGEALEARHIAFRGAKDLRYPKTLVTDLIELAALWSLDEGDLRLSALIGRWRETLRIDPNSAAGGALQEKLVAYLWHHRVPDMPLLSWLKGLYGLGLRDLTRAIPEWERELAALDVLARAVSSGGRLAGWTLREFALTRRKGALPHLVTIHSSKGLEYDAAIIVGLDPPQSDWAAKSAEEERRKLYVAITRARKTVYLLWSREPHPLVHDLVERAKIEVIPAHGR